MSNTLTVLNERGEPQVLYAPYPYQEAFHASNTPNLLALGTRNTGKSMMLRMDAILRCLAFQNFNALILRRTMPELRESHLIDIERECALLGSDIAVYTHTPAPLVRFPQTGSRISFRHCETEKDIMDFLSTQYGSIGFDELSTFSLLQFLMISAAARAPRLAPYRAVVRAGSNPLGDGADWMYDWFVDKTVSLEEFPDYHPEEFETQVSRLEDNKSADANAYRLRLGILPEHVRRAWLLGERVVDGAYFADFHPKKAGVPWHVIDEVPTVQGRSIFAVPWISIYRVIDWGYFPDPAVCLWIAVLPNKRAIAFKERSWKRTLASEVARQIIRESDGMQIVETFADPTMEIKTGTTFSIGELFDQQHLPLTYSVNDRELAGYAIHNYLNTAIEGQPQLQILAESGSLGCPNLIKTLPRLRMDPTHPSRIANGNDHYAIALGYFCLGQAPPSRDPAHPTIPRWMRPKWQTRVRL